MFATPISSIYKEDCPFITLTLSLIIQGPFNSEGLGVASAATERAKIAVSVIPRRGGRF